MGSFPLLLIKFLGKFNNNLLNVLIRMNLPSESSLLKKSVQVHKMKIKRTIVKPIHMLHLVSKMSIGLFQGL